MPAPLSLFRPLLVAALGLVAAAAAPLARAADNVYWSVGAAAPGVSVGVSNTRPYQIQAAPVYVQPAPVYVQPAPLYVPPPMYAYPQPVYTPPRVVYSSPVYVMQPAYLAYCSERPLYVEPCYQVSDRQREMGATPTRTPPPGRGPRG